jgi:hypothetical protein
MHGNECKLHPWEIRDNPSHMRDLRRFLEEMGRECTWGMQKKKSDFYWKRMTCVRNAILAQEESSCNRSKMLMWE